MYKNWFFRRVDRFIDWLENHQKSIYSISITIFFLLAAGVGGYTFWNYWKTPMFASPATIIEHMANIPFNYRDASDGLDSGRRIGCCMDVFIDD